LTVVSKRSISASDTGRGVGASIALLESLDDPLHMFRHAAEHWPGRIRKMPIHARLALEMAQRPDGRS